MNATAAKLSDFVLRPAQWDENAAAWSRLIPNDSPGSFADHLESEVKAGRAMVCHIEKAGRLAGFFVYTVTERHELLVHAAFGIGGANILPACFRELDTLARHCDCDTLRFHTMRPGMIVQAQRDGFRVSEVIMRRDVRHG